MSCPTNVSVFSQNPKINYDRIVKWDNTNEKCMSIAYDNSLSRINNNLPEIKEISCNAIKPNSKLVLYNYKDSSNNIISCPLGGWCTNIDNQQLLLSGIMNNQLYYNFQLTTIDGKTQKNMSDLCIPNDDQSDTSPSMTQPVKDNCNLNYFNNSLNDPLNSTNSIKPDCNAIIRENAFIKEMCKDKNQDMCTNKETNLALDVSQSLVSRSLEGSSNCAPNTITQTYQLIDTTIPLNCPIGFCDDVNNRNNLKDYMNNLTSVDPRCTSLATSNEPPSINNEIPVNNEPPSMTNQPPSMTNQPPSMTNEPPSMTNQPPSMTNEQPSMTNQPPSMTNEPPSMTNEPPSMTNESPSMTNQPPSMTNQPPSINNRFNMVNVKCSNNNTFQAYEITDSQNSTIICPVGDYCDKDENKINLKNAIQYNGNEYVIKNNAYLIPDGETEYNENNTISLFEMCGIP